MVSLESMDDGVVRAKTITALGEWAPEPVDHPLEIIVVFSSGTRAKVNPNVELDDIPGTVPQPPVEVSLVVREAKAIGGLP